MLAENIRNMPPRTRRYRASDAVAMSAARHSVAVVRQITPDSIGLVPQFAASLPKAAFVGIAGGALSGLFGVGGGIVMVPLFALWLGLEQRRAIATSLIAIIPIALAGMAGYATGSAVNWGAGLALGLGGVLGGQLGVWLLPRVPVRLLQGIFTLILLYSAYRLVFPAGDGGAGLEQSTNELWLLLAVVGLAAGVLAGLLGVGGGVILVPALVLLIGSNMNTARGTSLLVVLFTAITASITNMRNGRVDTRDGIIAGVCGAPAALIGSFLGQWIPDRQASWLFAALLGYAAFEMGKRALRKRDPDAHSDGAASLG